MRKFIVSDIHGFGNLYYSIMNYLDNISNDEEIELYINGDLIDRGLESAEILLDVKKRIEENKFKIVYIAGNHELMMYNTFYNYEKDINKNINIWYYNGGYITDSGLKRILVDDEKILEVANFVSNLSIYHKFEEKINNKPIVLVHASCPQLVEDECNLKIKDKGQIVFDCVWKRAYRSFIRSTSQLGNRKYFTIVGHTPNNSKYGVEYNEDDNYLNIDGGCARFVTGATRFNRFPLVEIMDNCLKILTFNGKKEIVYGNYFINNELVPLKKDELNTEQKYLIKK